MKNLFLFSILYLTLFCSYKLPAQSRTGIYIGGGTSWYYGDMNDRTLTHESLFRYYFNGGVNYKISNRVDVNANFTYAKIVGADSLAIQKFNLKRNLSFYSDVYEGSLLFNFRFWYLRTFNPYIIAGAGYMKFNPMVDFNNEAIELQPLGTEGQFISEGNYPNPYKLYSLTAPLGLGLEIILTKALSMRLEFMNHFTFTDYLDDVSGAYADSTKLGATPNGALAVELASNKSNGYPAEGKGRGNPNNNDNFATFGVTVVYRMVNNNTRSNHGVIGKKRSNKKHKCPAYN